MHHLLDKYFSLVRKFIPAEQKVSAVGLDIGTGECKAVELNRTEAGYELLNWVIEPVHNGDVKASAQKIFSQLTASCQSLYTSVFGKGTLIRYIDMPRMSLEDLKSSFDIEADKYFPFAQNQIYTDCFILDAKEKSKNMSVMAAAAKRELIDRRIKLLEELGMPVEFVGLNPIVLANALSVLGEDITQPAATPTIVDQKEKKEDNSGAKQEDAKKDKGVDTRSTVALLDMGESVGNLTILVDHLPWFTRDIFIGGRDFTKSISNALGISFQEAEKLKRNPEGKQQEVALACDTVIMNMVQELRLSIDYFATEKNREIDKLLITGGASMLEGITETFEKSLEIAVKTWNPVKLLRKAPGLAEEGLDRNSFKLGVALGLALYQYD